MPSKTKKFRGSRYHGRGKKAGRGKGKRGGKGNAGFFGHRLIWRIKNMPDHIGNHGFTSHHPKEDIVAINIKDIERNYDKFKETGLIETSESGDVIDLSKIGVNKLLGTGTASRKMLIHVKYASENAVEKVRAAGGDVIND